MTILVDTEDTHGLPTLHSALQTAFLPVSSGLLTIGAICSAVSCLITLFNLDGLVSYLYAFYDSIKLDTTHTNLQFDFLTINVKKSEEKQSYKDQMERPMDAYLNDQKLGQANKTQRNIRIMLNNISSISVNKSK